MRAAPPPPPSTPAPVSLTWTASGAANSFTPTVGYATTYFWQIVAYSGGASVTGPVWTFTTAAAPIDQVVICAGDIPPPGLHGACSFASDAVSPSGIKLVTSGADVASTSKALASQTDYIDVTSNADANRPYRIWRRMKALNNLKLNDSVWLQFSDTVAGGRSLRVQVREDGVQLDQIVLSATTYLNAAPGPVTADSTIVPKP